MSVWVGTSGWQYPHWRGRFYPGHLPERRWLSFYAERFRVVEVNNTFYRLPKGETVAGWADAVPDDFVFALKMSRFLTHVKRLRDPEEPVGRFLGVAQHLGPKLGPILLQLSPNHRADPDRLWHTLRQFPREVRVAVEFRHPSWFTEEVRGLLAEAGAALCQADRGSRPVTPLWSTADWGYVRFHFGTAWPPSGYGRTALGTWAARIHKAWGRRQDVYTFFNNDAWGCAIRDARALALALTARRVPASRVPPAAEIDTEEIVSPTRR